MPEGQEGNLASPHHRQYAAFRKLSDLRGIELHKWDKKAILSFLNLSYVHISKRDVIF